MGCPAGAKSSIMRRGSGVSIEPVFGCDAGKPRLVHVGDRVSAPSSTGERLPSSIPRLGASGAAGQVGTVRPLMSQLARSQLGNGVPRLFASRLTCCSFFLRPRYDGTNVYVLQVDHLSACTRAPAVFLSGPAVAGVLQVTAPTSESSSGYLPHVSVSTLYHDVVPCFPSFLTLPHRFREIHFVSHLDKFASSVPFSFSHLSRRYFFPLLPLALYPPNHLRRSVTLPPDLPLRLPLPCHQASI